MYMLVVLAAPCCNVKFSRQTCRSCVPTACQRSETSRSHRRGTAPHHAARSVWVSSAHCCICCHSDASARQCCSQRGHITEVWTQRQARTDLHQLFFFFILLKWFGQTPAASAGPSSGCWLGFNDNSCFYSFLSFSLNQTSVPLQGHKI